MVVAETSVEGSDGFKYRREDASGMSKVYAERFCFTFLTGKKKSFLVQVAALMSWWLGSPEILELRSK